MNLLNKIVSNINEMSEKEVFRNLNLLCDNIDFANRQQRVSYWNILKEYLRGTDMGSEIIKNDQIILTRARPNKGNNFHNNFENMIYPPVKNADLSRANYPQDPIFYCSNAPGTAVFEIRPNVGSWITTMNVQFKKPSLDLAVLGFDLDLQKSPNWNRASPKTRGVLRFLQNKFCEIIPKDKEHLYYQTAIVVKLILTDQDGVCFPSRASNLKGWNYAIKPEIINRFALFRKATVHEIVSVKSPTEIEIRCIHQATKLDKDKNFVWKPAPFCSGHFITENIYH